MSDWFRLEADGAVTILVHAQPGARRTEVAGLHGDSVRIRVSAPALEDRANEALVDFVAGRFGVARRDVTLVAGAKSRQKRLRIRGAALSPAEAMGL
jgi:uncharacterized protein (TIGR00251 family)